MPESGEQKMIDTKLISKYLENEDKYVFPFEIKEKQKTRKIITYNNDFNYGIKLRSIHERIRDEFDDNFSSGVSDGFDKVINAKIGRTPILSRITK